MLDRQRRLAEENDGSRISLEAFSASVGLSTRTLSRLLNRATPVDFRTAEALFFALDLVLNESDYYYSATYLGYRTALKKLPLPLTPLIGRDDVLERLEKLIATSRLVTLTGIGGIGKTRLAVEVARRREAKGDEQVWLFELAAVANPVESITNVATALGIAIDASGTFTTVREQLIHEPGILVLDDCEELAATLAPFILNLLRACPSLRVLATSREPLALEGERVFHVPPLAVPELTVGITASDAMQYPAIALFAEHARSTNDRFVFDDEIAQVAAEIVKNLDGVPLGIELAAARAEEVFSADFLLYLQEHRTNLQSGGNDPRHHSMSALMDWSFERLTDQERVVYLRSAVFSGSFDATALAAVCGDVLPLETAASVASQLARKSLLEIDVQTTPIRYVFLETVRQYARERLQETCDFTFSYWLHAMYYLHVTRTAMNSFRAGDQGEPLHSLTHNFANVRSALAWSFSAHNEHIGAALACALPEYWDARGQYREGEDWIRRALKVDGSLKTPATCAELCEGLSLLLYRQSRLEEASVTGSSSFAKFQSIGDGFGMCRVRNVLGIIAFDAGDVEGARKQHLANLEKGEMLGYRRITVAALTNLGRIELDVDGDARTALGRFQQSLELAITIGRQTLIANALGNTADAHAHLGNMFLAIDFSRRCMRVLHDLGNDALYCMQAMKTATFCVRVSGYQTAVPEFEVALDAITMDPYRTELCNQLDVIAELLIDDDEVERAVILLAATAAQRSRAGAPGTPASLRNRNILDRARGRVSTGTYEAARTTATYLSLEAAFRVALLPSTPESESDST